MKKFKFLVILLAAVAAGSVLFAQSQAPQKPKKQSGPPMMMCPMMSKNAGQPMMGNKNEMMKGMPQRMASMFSLSAEEISARLTEKKTDLGLSDVQVKQVADLIASSEQQKVETKMQGMMGQMQAGQMKCPCMQSGTK